MNSRKLIVLAVVLAFASEADATLVTWSEDAITMTLDGTAVVQLIADDDFWASSKSVGNSPSSVATIASIVALPAAGPDAIVQNPSQTGYPGWWWVQALNFEGPAEFISGPMFSVTIQAGSVTGTHELYSDYAGTNDMLEITVVPEPATVALLALSSLALLRKRRR